MGILVAFLLAVVSLIVSPLIAIWALNVVFPVLAIPVMFKTWLAVLALMLLLKAQISAKFGK